MMDIMKRNGAGSFFIKDLLAARKVGKGFSLKNTVTVNYVFLCGTISDIKKSRNGEKIIYTVEDGTACINCMTEANKIVKKNELMSGLELSDESVLIQMAVITATRTNQILNATAYQELKLGDSVKVFGKLRKDKDYNYVFGDKIEKITKLKFKVDYFKTLDYLYDHVYPEEFRKCIKYS